MNIHQVGTDETFSPESFGDSVTDVWHNYWSASWEGGGWMIVKYADGRWDCISLAHCSCNGPLDDLRSEGVFATLDDLIAAHSKEAYGQFQAIADAARAAS